MLNCYLPRNLVAIQQLTLSSTNILVRRRNYIYSSRVSSTPTTTRSFSSSSSSSVLPSHAQVVVIGGGIIGNSILYHLAKGGWKDVILLERDKLTSGTTWHAAGLMVTFGSFSETSTSFRKYSRDLYTSIEEETGQSSGFKPVGFIELAADKGRLEEYRRIAALNRSHGVDVREISASEVKSLAPMTRVDDILAGFYVEKDGRVNPVDASMALAKGAKMNGARIYEGESVFKVESLNGRVTGVVTDSGHRISCDFVVNAAGMWARQLGAQNNIAIPLQACEHYYLITDTMPDVNPNWPVIEDPGSFAYIRPEAGGMMVGLFETQAAAWNVNSIPRNFSFGSINPDLERITSFLQKAMERVPKTLEVGAKQIFCGPESFTHDGAPILGEAPELRGYFIAAGLNSIGILTGGGVGRLIANWIMKGFPDQDVTGVNADRAMHYMCTPAYRASRNVETLGKVYKCQYPSRQPKMARNNKRSPLHDSLKKAGATMKDVSGWEGADYYDKSIYSNSSLTWERAPWFETWAMEHKMCRERAALIDMSFMSKFIVTGPGSTSLLQWLCTADIAGTSFGTITYTQLCNERGTLEGDITVTKLPLGQAAVGFGGSDDISYLVVATDTAHRHVETWLRRHAVDKKQEFGYTSIVDISGGLAQINIQGPLSRTILQRVTSEDMNTNVFPFRSAKYIDIGYARVLCTRITYVGELGFELFIPAEQAVHVYETLCSAANTEELFHVGLKALGSLRMEKGYRDYGHDLDNCDTLMEAGLAFTADTTKNGGFLGMKKLLEQRSAGGVNALSSRLVQVFCSDPKPLMYRGEILLANGIPVGDVRSASYGHTLEGAVGIGYIKHPNASSGGRVDKTFIETCKWQVDIAGIRYPCLISSAPFYDPLNKKIKC